MHTQIGADWEHNTSWFISTGFYHIRAIKAQPNQLKIHLKIVFNLSFKPLQMDLNLELIAQSYERITDGKERETSRTISTGFSIRSSIKAQPNHLKIHATIVFNLIFKPLQMDLNSDPEIKSYASHKSGVRASVHSESKPSPQSRLGFLIRTSLIAHQMMWGLSQTLPLVLIFVLG